MKYEQKVQVETQEYICFVKRIDGVVAQKNLVSELIRCKDCHFYKSENLQCMMHEGDTEEWYGNDYCSLAERKENETN